MPSIQPFRQSSKAGQAAGMQAAGQGLFQVAGLLQRSEQIEDQKRRTDQWAAREQRMAERERRAMEQSEARSRAIKNAWGSLYGGQHPEGLHGPPTAAQASQELDRHDFYKLVGGLMADAPDAAGPFVSTYYRERAEAKKAQAFQDIATEIVRAEAFGDIDPDDKQALVAVAGEDPVKARLMLSEVQEKAAKARAEMIHNAQMKGYLDQMMMSEWVTSWDAQKEKTGKVDPETGEPIYRDVPGTEGRLGFQSWFAKNVLTIKNPGMREQFARYLAMYGADGKPMVDNYNETQRQLLAANAEASRLKKEAAFREAQGDPAKMAAYQITYGPPERDEDRFRVVMDRHARAYRAASTDEERKKIQVEADKELAALGIDKDSIMEMVKQPAPKPPLGMNVEGIRSAHGVK